MKTAINNLIDKLLPYIDRSKISDTMLQNIVEESILKEKQQIVNAAIWMPEHFNTEFIPELGQKYYNETYGNKD